MVTVVNDKARVMELQKNHGEWMDAMQQVLFAITLLTPFAT